MGYQGMSRFRVWCFRVQNCEALELSGWVLGLKVGTVPCLDLLVPSGADTLTPKGPKP